MTFGTKTLTLVSLSLFVMACGGSKPAESADSAEQPAETADEKPAEGADKGEDKADAEGSSDAEDKGSAKEEKKEAPAEETATFKRTPKDIITAPDVVFMLAYNDSDPKKEAEKKCDATAGTDPKKKNECMAKLRKKVTIDGLQFKQENGTWWWLTLRKQGTRLVNIHKVEFTFGAEDKQSIVIKPQGKDKGAAPWGRVPKEVTIEVPNEYQIAVKDADYGNLVYDAKIGIVGTNESK